MQKQFQRYDDVANNNVCRFYGFRRSAFGADHGDADAASRHHPAIVPAIANADAAGRAQTLDERELCRGLIVTPFEDAQLAWISRESGGRPAKRIGGDDMDGQIPGQLRHDLAYARKKHAVPRQRSIIVEYQVLKPQNANAWNAYLDHLTSPRIGRQPGSRF
jgi:hypothetical protein